MSKYIELAKKLKSLSEGGEGGEATNAKAALDKLMRKHNITPDMLESEQEGDHVLYVKNMELLSQIAVVCLGKSAKCFSLRGVKKRHLGLICTQAKALEIESMYHHYEQLLKKEQEIFFYAFLKANKLLAPHNINGKQPTRDDIERAKRAAAMSLTIKAESYRKSLNCGLTPDK